MGVKATAEDLRRLMSDFDGRADTEAIADAISRGDKRALRALLREAWATVAPGLAARLETTVVNVTTTSYGAAWAAVTSKPYPPPTAAIEHAGRQAARRVTAMTNQSRVAIRQLVTAAISGRAGNHRLARQLVTSGLGLDTRRAGALARYHNTLQGLVSAGKVTPEKAAARVVRRGNRMARSRAMTIARTESREARGYARQKAWDGLLKNGIIRDAEWEKTWHTFHDEKTSDECTALSRQVTTVSGAFSDGYTRPPRHPNCRCSCSIRRRRKR